jgi:hypothetical protein
MTMGDFGFAQPRRGFLQQCAGGLGMIALWHLLAEEGRADEEAPDVNPLKPKPPHFPAKAKSVIFLFMAGGPSHLDLFDPKPSLQKWDGQALPESMSKNLNLAFIKPTAKIWPSPRTFRHYGTCGTEFADLIPPVSSCLFDPLHVHRADQSSSGPTDDELRFSAGRPAFHGGLGNVRVGKRVPRPSRFCGLELRRRHKRGQW